MKITLRDGRVFSGTPLQIVQGMRAVAFNKSDATLDQYIEFVADNVRRNDELSITVPPGTEEERSASLIAELQRIGFAQ